MTMEDSEESDGRTGEAYMKRKKEDLKGEE